jgi:hemerythrin superfamily protein
VPSARTAAAAIPILPEEALNTGGRRVDALKLLQSQHREVEQLFKAYGELEDGDTPGRKMLFLQLADALAAHATIEETHFYPAIKAKQTEELVLESLEDHLAVKRVLADLLDLQPSDRTFDAKIMTLKELVERHVGEEETDLFPKVRSMFKAEELEEIGVAMESTFAELMAEGEPSGDIPNQTAKAPRV